MIQAFFCGSMTIPRVVQAREEILLLIYFHDMSIENYRDLDCEANGMTSIAQSHHLHIPRGYDSTKLLKKV